MGLDVAAVLETHNDFPARLARYANEREVRCRGEGGRGRARRPRHAADPQRRRGLGACDNPEVRALDLGDVEIGASRRVDGDRGARVESVLIEDDDSDDGACRLPVDQVENAVDVEQARRGSLDDAVRLQGHAFERRAEQIDDVARVDQCRIESLADCHRRELPDALGGRLRETETAFRHHRPVRSEARPAAVAVENLSAVDGLLQRRLELGPLGRDHGPPAVLGSPKGGGRRREVIRRKSRSPCALLEAALLTSSYVLEQSRHAEREQARVDVLTHARRNGDRNDFEAARH